MLQKVEIGSLLEAKCSGDAGVFFLYSYAYSYGLFSLSKCKALLLSSSPLLK